MKSELVPLLQAALGSQYEILSELGGAGMSRVFLAREVALGREVVVKILPPDVAADIKAERFQREIQLVARLQHPNIVPILAAGSAAGILYYTMPYVSGQSLAKKIVESTRLNHLEAMRILRDVADALSYAHSERVIHRDVKPQNILLKGQHAMVVDFGVAKAITAAADDSALTATGLALGTPMYIAPEQAMAEPDVDGRADIYSLGVVAYEVLTGRVPFKAASQQALLAAHVTTLPQPIGELNPELPQRLAALVMSCLEKDPAKRPQSAEEVRDEFNSMVARFTPTGDNPVTLIEGHVPESSARIGAAVAKAERAAGTLFQRKSAAALALLVITLGAAAGVVYRERKADPAVLSTVAVLPFEDVDSAAGSAYFAEGITRELGSQLGKIDGLRVASMTSSAAASRRLDDVRRIASSLKVGAVVEGTIRHSGSTVVVRAQLTNGKTGYQMWSSEFTDESRNVGAVQSKIARAIGTALVGRLVPRRGHRLDDDSKIDPRVLDYYNKGKYLENDFDREKLEQAIANYQLALSIDTSFARAHAAIANAMYHLADDYLPPREAYPQVREAALKAIKLDSTLAEAHASLGAYEISYGWNWRQARSHLDRALQLDPQSAFAHMLSGWYYIIVGRRALAVEEALKASSLDPFSDEIAGNVVSLMRAAGRHDLASATLRYMLANDVGVRDQLYARLSRESLARGDFTMARAQLDSALAVSPGCCRRTLVFVHASEGQVDSATRLIERLETLRTRGYYRADYLAEARAAVNDTTRVFAWLEQAYADRSSSFPLFPASVELSRYEADARYKSLVARLKLPAP